MHPSAELGRRPGISRAQWLTLAAGFLGWMFDGVEMGLFPLCARPVLNEMMGPDLGSAPGWGS